MLNLSRRDLASKDVADLNRMAIIPSLFIWLSVSFGAVWLAVGSYNFGRAAIFCLAAFSVGMLFGFLFGVPKFIASKDSLTMPLPTTNPAGVTAQPVASARKYLPNTNLEEVSDWLTKIIVGLGLVNLSKVPAAASSLGRAAAASFPDGKVAASLLVAVFAAFGVVGFLWGYLVTRVFWSVEIRKADDEGADDAVQKPDEALRLLKQDVLNAPQTSSAISDNHVAAKDELDRLAEEYLRIDDPDHSVRTRLKRDAAAKMGRLIIDSRLNRDDLSTSVNEGIIVGLANAIVFAPEAGDANRIVRVAPRVTRLHVQYSIVLAYLALLQAKLIDSASKVKMLGQLDMYYERADSGLQAAIQDARHRSGTM